MPLGWVMGRKKAETVKGPMKVVRISEEAHARAKKEAVLEGLSLEDWLSEAAMGYAPDDRVPFHPESVLAHLEGRKAVEAFPPSKPAVESAYIKDTTPSGRCPECGGLDLAGYHQGVKGRPCPRGG